MKKKQVKDRTLYQQEYYESHKDELSKKRKKRYHGDAAVRERAKEASRVYRAKEKARRDILRANGELPDRRNRGPRKPVSIIVNGVSQKGYTISVLAKRIGRSVAAVNNWIRMGTIPKTPFWSYRGDRLYTDGMILVVKLAIQPRGIVGRNPDIYDQIIDGWNEMGVGVTDTQEKC